MSEKKITELLRKRDIEIEELKAQTQEELKGVGKKNRKRKKAIWAKTNEEEKRIRERYDELLEEFEKEDVEKAMASLKIGNDEEKKEDDCAVKKLTKSQRRRLKREERDRKEAAEREAAIEAQKGKTPRDKENESIQRQLSLNGLTMKEIPSDGNCMYRAVSHQIDYLSTSDHGGDSSKSGYIIMRRMASEYMRSHKDDFLPFFTAPKDEKDVEKAYEEHCDRVCNTSEWGGQLELRALMLALKRSIHVYSADSPVMKMGADDDDRPALRLTFHRHYYALGEHYNSVVVNK